jgi:ppGpp synthetase/RelA/SpoT-type nucleotidyltranferase
MVSITPSAFFFTGKPAYDQYKAWLLETHKVSVDPQMENHYAVICDTAHRAFEQCEVWTGIVSGLRELNDKFLISHKCALMKGFSPRIVTKPFNSFLEKTYRKNILFNSNFPEPPKGGWLLPDNCHSAINDIIRTTITVNYLDGVEYVLGHVQRAASERGVGTASDNEARMEGYYAIHLYYRKEIRVIGRDFTSKECEFSFEIQITTEIKEIVKTILHAFYDKARLAATKDGGRDWRWDYKSDEFVANNIGHVIHYIEGMIVQVRDRQGGFV